MTNAIHRLLVEGVEPDYANLVAHPLASIMPMMSEEEFERHKADIKRNGLQVRIDLFEGRSSKAGTVTVPCAHSALFSFQALHRYEGRSRSLRHLEHRRQLNNKQKQEFAQMIIRKYPTESDRALARLTSLSKNTIAVARDALENTLEKRKSDAFAKSWIALTDDQQVAFVLEHVPPELTR
jgi:hypothetical protein